jgi:hypothetical protein
MRCVRSVHGLHSRPVEYLQNNEVEQHLFFTVLLWPMSPVTLYGACLLGLNTTLLRLSGTCDAEMKLDAGLRPGIVFMRKGPFPPKTHSMIRKQIAAQCYKSDIQTLIHMPHTTQAVCMGIMRLQFDALLSGSN